MPIPESRLFQLVHQQLEAHLDRKIPLSKVGNHIAVVSITPSLTIPMKIRYSTDHRPEWLRQHLSRVAWLTFSEADFANSAPPFLTIAQGPDENSLVYLTVPRPKLRQALGNNGSDWNMYFDYAKAGHVYSSRGLSRAAREACARSRQYLTEHYPERDLTEWLGNWQQLDK